MSNRKTIIGGWVAIGAAVVAGEAMLVRPSHRERDRIDARLRDLAARDAERAALTDEVDRLGTEIEDRHRRLAATRRRIPRESDIAALVDGLSLPVDGVTVVDQAFAAGTPFTAAARPGARLRGVPLTIELTGSFDSVFALIRRAESIDRLVRVNSVHLVSHADEQWAPGPPMLAATVGLDAIYLEPDGHRGP